jgi:hypothetical protein
MARDKFLTNNVRSAAGRALWFYFPDFVLLLSGIALTILRRCFSTVAFTPS